MGGTNVCSNSPGFMINMAATPMYGKNPLKLFFSGTNREMTLKLGIQYWGLKFLSNEILPWPWLTLRQGQIWFLMLFMLNCWNIIFYRNYLSLWTESLYIPLTKWVHEYIWVPTVTVIVGNSDLYIQTSAEMLLTRPIEANCHVDGSKNESLFKRS